MKPICFISLFFLFFATVQGVFSQNQTPQRRTPPRQRAAETATDHTPVLSERAKIKNEETSKTPTHVAWLREMYRYIDLEKENNAALYYPVQPIGDRMNLFTTVFKLIADGKITVYNYPLNGQEVFTDAEKVNFEDILKKYRILYQKQGSGDNIKYVVDEIDIPSMEVLTYLIKEGWYFDAATGAYKSQVTAICPLLVRTDYDAGDTTKDPLFWIPYETLRPYLSRAMIMTSNYNNALTYTIDDFFTKNMYSGDIVKTVNLKDQSLAQQVGNDPEKLKLAQDSIENQLKTFEKQLWVQEDTTNIVSVDKKAKKESVKRESVKKEEKPKATKPEKSSAPASPTKSVRRTR